MTKQNDEVRVSPASQALERSIRRALRNHKRAQKKLKTDPVHDFRVALRRCRSLAEGFSAIDPGHRSPRALDEAAKRGDLARAARHGEALPVHGRKLPAPKERGMERRTRADSGPAW